jgi:small subunit ribosomal protein S6
MRKYEIMFIVDPNVPEDAVDQISSQVEGVITDGGGEVEQIEKMGRRKLAYEIDKKREGFYVLLTVGANGDIIKEVERRFRVMDQILRYLTVRIDEEQKKLDKVRAERERKAARRVTNRPATPAESSPTN